jgi:signal transduction histidine kinase
MKEFSHPGSKEKVAINLNTIIQTPITVATNEWKYVAEIKTDLDPALPEVPCLSDEMGQVILNMVVNAAHAISDTLGANPEGKKGVITLSTRHDEGWVELRISDTGAGIPEAIRGRVFDPFFTTKKVGKGTGQGLAIVHDVITDKHQGTISFESEVGAGTTFIIRLPINS